MNNLIKIVFPFLVVAIVAIIKSADTSTFKILKPIAEGVEQAVVPTAKLAEAASGTNIAKPTMLPHASSPLNGRGSGELIEAFVKSVDEEQTEKAFVERITLPELKTFAIVPRSKTEFRTLFPGNSYKDWTEGQARQIASEMEDINSLNSVQLATANDSKKELLNAISSSEDRFIVIVGHNENGELKLLDSSSIHLNELAEECERSRTTCIFLSCNSAVHVQKPSSRVMIIRSDITFGDAALIARAIESSLQRSAIRQAKVSFKQIHADVAATLRSAELATRIGSEANSPIVVIGGGGTGGLAIAYYSSSSKE